MYMASITDEDYEKLVGEAIDAIPKLYKTHLQNVAFIIEDNPSPQQRVQLHLYPNETLYGLYEGVPLPQRGGVTKLLPDKITLFKKPMLASTNNMDELKELLRHTIWLV
jgi:predicted Zn-dependent protease with MMP-like domain